MRLTQKISSAAFLVVAISCGHTPQGFTPEGWERLKRENPNRAQVIIWVEKRPS